MSSHDELDFHGLPAIAMQAPDGARAVVTLHGAHTVSWQSADGIERLYLSERSIFAAGKAIRGGIPVIFPQFSNQGPLPRHGFARTLPWQLEQRHTGTDFVGVTLSLVDSPATRTVWPHGFRAELTLSVARNRFDVELSVENIGVERFDFSAALHTYLRVAHVESTQVSGLQGCTYRDQTAGGKEHVEQASVLEFEGEIDRIYLTAPAEVMLRQPGQSLSVSATAFPDLVVWNPWVDKCAQLSDMPADGFKRMVCLEAAVIESPISLSPRQEWWGRQTLVAIK